MRNDDGSIDDDATTGLFIRPTEVTPEPVLDEHRLWDANDVAHYLKVSRSWVYHRAEAGLLPVRRVGGLLRFDPAAIRAFAIGEAANPASDGGGGHRPARPPGHRTRR
jgi:predicted DNA-binding transcriptional regulator AlpA